MKIPFSVQVAGSLWRKVFTLGTATLASRILGFVRDALIAMLLGAGSRSDMFLWAFRFPELLRKCFSDGLLNLSFVPVFTGVMTSSGKETAMVFARAALVWVSALAAVLAVAATVLAPWLIRNAAPGFAGDPASLALTVLLSRIMIPYLVCVAILAVCMGVLNALDRFAAPALAPLVLNLAIIASALRLAPGLQEPGVGLAIGVLAGGGLQLVLQVPFLVSSGLFRSFGTRLFHPGLGDAAGRFFPTVLGAAVYPLNLLCATWMAASLPGGSVSHIYYADRLVQFPMALFSVSVSVALLPELSRAAALRDIRDASRIFTGGMKLVLAVTLPAMAGLAVLREPVVALLFRQGAFDAAAVRDTASALLCLLSGLWAFSGARVYVTLHHAFGRTGPPLWSGIAAIGCNLLMSLVLMPSMGYLGLLISVSLASSIQFLLLVRASGEFLGTDTLRDILICACRSVPASGIMALVVYAVASFTGMNLHSGKTLLASGVLVSVFAGVAVYGILFLCAGRLERKKPR
jgi:putative peptidoglycan lipid II flippase